MELAAIQRSRTVEEIREQIAEFGDTAKLHTKFVVR